MQINDINQLAVRNPVHFDKNYDQSVQKRYNDALYWFNETDRTVNILARQRTFAKSDAEVTAKHAIKINIDTGTIIENSYFTSEERSPERLTVQEIQAIFDHFRTSSTQ